MTVGGPRHDRTQGDTHQQAPTSYPSIALAIQHTMDKMQERLHRNAVAKTFTKLNSRLHLDQSRYHQLLRPKRSHLRIWPADIPDYQGRIHRHDYRESVQSVSLAAKVVRVIPLCAVPSDHCRRNGQLSLRCSSERRISCSGEHHVCLPSTPIPPWFTISVCEALLKKRSTREPRC